MMRERRLQRWHELALYAAVILGAASVAAQSAGLVASVLFALSLPVSWAVHQRGWLQRVPNNLWTGLVLAALLITGAIMASDEAGAILHHGVRFILLLIVVKLLSRRGERDVWQLYALSFLLLAAGTAVNEDLLYGFIFASYVVVGTFGLALFHLTREAHYMRGESAPQVATSRYYMGVLGALAALMFAFSAFIFFAFPRVGLGFFAKKEREGLAMTGFSTRVELGSHGLIRDNPAVALRISRPGQDTAPPGYQSWRWRVMAFDTYDGVSWSRSPKLNKRPLRGDKEQRYDLRERLGEGLERATRGVEPALELEIYSEPLGTPRLPLLWLTSSVQPGARGVNLPFDPRRGYLATDALGDVWYERRNEQGIIYQMQVLPTPPLEPLRRAVEEPAPVAADEAQDADAQARLPPHRRRRAPSDEPTLQLPENIPRLRQLAAQVSANATTPWEKAAAIEAHLKSAYGYTVDLPPLSDPSNPIEGFLFETRRGHCEFFATAMTLMVRSQGVRARMVNGFLGGTWNDVGGYVAVRQGDAHAWVEVEIPGQGWVPFDPTPTSSAPPHGGALVQLFRMRYDALKMGWSRWVLEYGLDNQIDGARAMLNALSKTPRFLEGGEGGEEEEARDDDAKKRQVPVAQLVWLCGLLGFLILAKEASQRTLQRPRAQRVALMLTLALLAGAWTHGFGHLPQVSALAALAVMVSGLIAGRFATTRARAPAAHALLEPVERAATRAGVGRRVDEGSAQFLARLGARYPKLAPALERFSASYLEVRFGQRPLGPATRRALRAQARALAQGLRAEAREPHD